MRKDILRLDLENDEFSMVDIKAAAIEIYEAVKTDRKVDTDEMFQSLSFGERIVTSKAIYRRLIYNRGQKSFG